MRALSLRGALALVVASTLALASVGGTAVSANAASVAGTFALSESVPDFISLGTMFADDSSYSVSNIPGIRYEAFFSDNGSTPTSELFAGDLGGGTGKFLFAFDPVPAFVVRSTSSVPFALKSFRMQDAQAISAVYTATAYRSGAVVGTQQFTTSGNYNPVTITLSPLFLHVDAVRITSDGGTGGAGATLWQEGFNTFVVADSVKQADLSGLTISAGALTPSFQPAIDAYSRAVANNVSSTTVTPTATTPGATVTVNGVAVASGSPSGAIALNVGANTITTVVTALDGLTTKTYTITVTRAAPPSSNANLSALSLSSGSLAPAFASATTGYTASVAFTTTSLTVTPTRADAGASITVNGVTVTSGTPSGAIALAVGSNTITTVVTAQDLSTTKTYTTTVTRNAASSINALSALSLSSGTLSPTFASATTSYTASVSNATTSLTVTPTVADSTSSVTVNGVATTSGNASGAIALAVGSNTITTTVTAQNGTPLSYTVTVTRAASSNADLSALSLSSGTLAPAFAAATTSYTASVSNPTTSLTVTPTIASGSASMTVNGVAVSSGNASGAVALNVGSNTLTIVVTAQDGTTTKTYTVTVTRAASSNNNLSALALSAGTLAPAFAAGTTSYTAGVASAVTSLRVTPTVAESNASVTVNGVAVASGAQSAPIALAVGSNTVTVVVTAQNGATRTYTVTVTRAQPSSNSALAALTLSSGTLSPAFAGGTLDYTVALPHAVDSVTVTPTVADSTATVAVNGTPVASGSASAPLAFAVGSTTVAVLVTAQDGSTTGYTITVTRAPSAIADLSALTISAGTLAPAFDTTTTAYSTTVSNATTSLTLTPVAADGTASITVNGTGVPSGSASGPIALAVGTTIVTTVVVSPDGSTTRTYAVSVERLASSDSSLSALVASDGTLDPAFAPSITTYDLETSESTITVTPTVSDTTATVTVNGLATTSGSPSAAIALPLGGTTITTTVTAQNGSTTEYVIDVFRAGDPEVTLTHDLVVGAPAAGSNVTFTGADLAPGSTWTVTLHSTPVVLASGTIGASGLLNVTVTLPAGIDPGAHRVALVITPPAGAALTSTIWFTVLANGAVGAISLAGPVFPALVVTGVDAVSMMLASLLALLAGTGMIVVARRRELRVARPPVNFSHE